ncbi:DEAD/DEAH box helicase family protein [Rossellomorea vietnamensis]|uniref:DEAD/DEAH box helicase family protein n=1 Tax=Rossellomorea vietnamensis TaxID=218284 RepID=UPI003CE801A8
MSDIQLVTSHLGKTIKGKIQSAKSVYILTSFSMKSGVRYLKNALKLAAELKADIKLLTGDYLNITQPEALKELMSIDDRIEVRLWKSGGVSFHPKAYLIETSEGEFLVVGSSNLSASALTEGVEWNLAVQQNKELFEEVQEQFMHLFYHEKTISVNNETIKEYESEYKEYHDKYPHLIRKWTEQEEIEAMLPEEDNKRKDIGEIHEPEAEYGTIEPRFAQIEALEELEKTYDEGYKKAMVVMATGLGKTYLAAFFAKRFKRVLFVAHREEILHQAEKSFRIVMPEASTGIYNGRTKEGEADCVFASVFTLSMKKHLEAFNPNSFDLIVIDEFHHAAADSYQRLLSYFHPEFLLGITATPDRNDNRDVYALCEGNVAFKMDFLEAIQRNWLSPFQYFGVYDETDYSQIRWLGNRYDEEQLLLAQLREDMAGNIINAWEKHKQTKSLVFCSSIRQAVFLSDYFNRQGYNTVSLHSQQKDISRKEAIRQLESGTLDAIFTVDLFNEGIDIPSVDTILFVRPTESLTVFTQQIGRGLRLHSSKDYCVIIDLIGNYRHADVKLSVFDQELDGKRKKGEILPTVPESCAFEIDVKAINLINELARKQQPRKQLLLAAYRDVKQELGRRPTYLELHLKGSMGAKPYYDEWKSYHAFLEWAGELTEKEEEAFLKYEEWFREVEKTGMQKSYKMVLLSAMLERGQEHWYDPITPEEAAPYFHHYLTSEEYRKRIDFSEKSSQKLWEYDEKKVASLIKKMPMTMWSGSSKGLITLEDNKFEVHVDPAGEGINLLYQFTKEICQYRLHYFFQRREDLKNR